LYAVFQWVAFMLGIRFIAAGFSALSLTVVMAPTTAQAQSVFNDCYEVFGPGSADEFYTECGESAKGVAAVGHTLGAIGDSYLQQQINGRGAAGTSGLGVFVGPTGKLRTTDHDGLREKNSGLKTGSFEVDEGSVFGNVSYDIPGTVFGGKVRVSALAGYVTLDQEAGDDATSPSKTEIDGFMYGGSYLWSQGSFYTMSVIIGLTSEADTVNIGGSYSYDIDGYYSNSVVGNTFDAGPLKFDLRGGVGYYDLDGGSFIVPLTTTLFNADAAAWNASLTGTLFSIIELEGGGVMRPYILAAYKHVFDEEIDVKGAGGPVSYEQAEDYGKVELGADLVQGAMTFGGAAYTEFSADENTFGGRLGVSVKFN
jgi:hypothetical protein